MNHDPRIPRHGAHGTIRTAPEQPTGARFVALDFGPSARLYQNPEARRMADGSTAWAGQPVQVGAHAAADLLNTMTAGREALESALRALLATLDKPATLRDAASPFWDAPEGQDALRVIEDARATLARVAALAAPTLAEQDDDYPPACTSPEGHDWQVVEGGGFRDGRTLCANCGADGDA